MCDEGIQPQEQSAAKYRHTVVETLGQTGGSDRNRAVRQPADHDGIHNSHAHPSDFGDDERQRQTDCQQKVSPPHCERSFIERRLHLDNFDYINSGST